MTNKQNPKFQELVAKLREIFQIDRPELDFGIYRILNARAGEINDYLQNRLAEKVQAALSAGSATSAQQLQAELQEAEKNAQALGVSPDAVPKVQELRAKLKEATAGSSEHENAVFSHLLAFFSRYYEQGDFISQRRYKGDTYAIPYAGEEVMLHWANKDQYYTKSGENFSNYSFKLEDGRTVHFRLAAADTAKDNRKDNDKERRFALVAAKTVTRLDENGDEYEEELVPVEEFSGSDGNQELIIRFEYVAQPKGTKQEALVTKAVEAVLADAAVKARWLALGNRAPTEKSPQRTLLEKHLSDYTTKNTADYFIHKDLGGFLRRELSFYIKNEVMNLDDVQNAGAFADIEKNLLMIQCLRSIALELITFLAQLESFQKKLWLKRRFVTSAHYLVTLNRVPNELHSTVVHNHQQWEQWRSLNLWQGDDGSLSSLSTHQYLMVDSSLFDQDFTRRLLASFLDVDDVIDGLIVYGEEYSTTRFLRERYKEKIDLVYLDPPYNTGGDDFLYKDGYKHSTWATFAHQSLTGVRDLLTEKAPLFCSIDDNEYVELSLVASEVFGSDNILPPLVWKRKAGGGDDSDHIATEHEYIALFCRDKDALAIQRIAHESAAMTAKYNKEENSRRYYLERLDKTSLTYSEEMDYPIKAPDGSFVEPPQPNPSRRTTIWRWSKSKVATDRNLLVFQKDKKTNEWRIYTKTWEPDQRGVTPRSLLVDKEDGRNRDGTQEIAAIFEPKVFKNPKPTKLLKKVVGIGLPPDGLCADFFAGSGTTGHAVIELNREDSGRRKYILADVTSHSIASLHNRVQKIVYSSKWENGIPSAAQTGITQVVKVLKLESYEDTLNNLQLRRTTAQDDLLNTLPQQAKDDYLLNYQLDVESRDSLLSVDGFKKPFDYTLNVAVDSAGAFEPRKIDLVETFNFLIGLRVKHIDAQPQRGFVTVTGTLPSNETCLVLWRDCDVLDYEGISKLCDKLAINPADNEFDVVYINGDHNIPTVLTQTAEEGGGTRVLKLRQIEPEFLERMFSVEDI